MKQIIDSIFRFAFALFLLVVRRQIRQLHRQSLDLLRRLFPCRFLSLLLLQTPRFLCQMLVFILLLDSVACHLASLLCHDQAIFPYLSIEVSLNLLDRQHYAVKLASDYLFLVGLVEVKSLALNFRCTNLLHKPYKFRTSIIHKGTKGFAHNVQRSQRCALLLQSPIICRYLLADASLKNCEQALILAGTAAFIVCSFLFDLVDVAWYCLGQFLKFSQFNLAHSVDGNADAHAKATQLMKEGERCEQVQQVFSFAVLGQFISPSLEAFHLQLQSAKISRLILTVHTQQS